MDPLNPLIFYIFFNHIFLIHQPYKQNSMKMQNILFYAAKWNCYNPLESLIENKKIPGFKTTWSKQFFFSDIKNFLIEVR